MRTELVREYMRLHYNGGDYISKQTIWKEMTKEERSSVNKQLTIDLMW